MKMTTPKKTTNSYWDKRAKQERKWQEKNIATDAAFNRLIARYYRNAIVQINKDIDHQYQALAKSVGGLKNAYSEVSAADIANYEVEAQELVMQAAQMRAAGKKVTYATFSDDVNRRMKIYNATMRINRLEYLKSQVGLHLTDANMNIANELGLKLTDDYVKETKRQAGILGRNLKFNNALIDNQNVAKIVMASTEGANWSTRLWANQDALKAQLDAVLSTGMITGQSNQAMARKLKDQIKSTVKNHSYVAERLARTESARVQYQAQIDSIKAADYKYVKWYAEPGACRVCQRINDNDEYDLGYGVYPVDEAPEIPIHPNCRCSISAYWVEGKNNLHHKKAKEHVANDSSDKPRNDEVKDAIAKTNMAKEVSPKVEKKFVEAINSSPDTVRNMYIKQGGNLHFVKSNGKPYVEGLNIHISEKDALKMENKAPLQALVHETAHYLDAEPSSIKFKAPSDSVGLGEALKNDFYKAVYGDLPTENSLGKRPRRNSKAYPEWRKKSDELFDARKQAEKRFDERIEQLKTLDKASTSDLSDMIEAQASLSKVGKWNYQPLGNGHTASYWDSEATAASEFFADVTSEMVTNPEALKLTKEFFPTAFEKYGDIVKLINKRTDLKYIP